MKLFFTFLLLALSSRAFSTEAAAVTAVTFEKRNIKLVYAGVTTKIRVEIAQSEGQLTRGLMFRKSIKDNEGMLFEFASEEPRTFWMKNTFVALSIGFFDANKKLIDIQNMKPVASEMDANPPTYSSAGPAQYALEVPQGWFAKKKIKVGAILSDK